MEWNECKENRWIFLFESSFRKILEQMCENVIVTRSNIESNRRYSKGRGNEVFLQFRSKFSEELRRFLLPCVEEKKERKKIYFNSEPNPQLFPSYHRYFYQFYSFYFSLFESIRKIKFQKDKHEEIGRLKEEGKIVDRLNDRGTIF